jgi:hypothetical protein
MLNNTRKKMQKILNSAASKQVVRHTEHARLWKYAELKELQIFGLRKLMYLINHGSVYWYCGCIGLCLQARL